VSVPPPGGAEVTIELVEAPWRTGRGPLPRGHRATPAISSRSSADDELSIVAAAANSKWIPKPEECRNFVGVALLLVAGGPRKISHRRRCRITGSSWVSPRAGTYYPCDPIVSPRGSPLPPVPGPAPPPTRRKRSR
jgi:hypothetical protein